KNYCDTWSGKRGKGGQWG
ncbi:hypothetical protein CISIN_1g0122371mg, partial [Citrus sinensis]